jgi:uncharacterized membrane protein YeiH
MIEMVAAIERFQFPLTLEVIATLAWAVSGAIVARTHDFDFTGVFVIAVLASTGGGLLRDGIFLQVIPAVMTQPYFLLLGLLGALLISLFGRQWERLDWWDVMVNMIDAIGTPAYALIGFQLSLLAGIPLVGALFIALVNGVAGGILRDVLVGEVPRFLRPGQHSTIILIAALFLYVGLIWARVDSNSAAWIVIGVAAVARWLVIRFNWQTQPVSQWAAGEKITGLPNTFTRGLRRSGAERPSTPKTQSHATGKAEGK